MSQNNDWNRRNQQKKANSNRSIFITLGILAFVLFGCIFGTVLAVIPYFRDTASNEATIAAETSNFPFTWEPESAELTIAVSPLMASTLESLADDFNRQQSKTPDGRVMKVVVTALEPGKMVETALGQPPFQAISPDSNLWIDRLEQRWLAQLDTGAISDIPLGQRRIAESERYAVSPIVIAIWESVARDLGWPDKAIGWQDIQQQATRDPNFKWSHPSTGTATGLLATLAEFYAGANLTRGLTQEAATAQSTVDYVRAVEGTVRFYGEGEDVVVQRLISEGRNYLDAFVAQERVVIDWNENRAGSGERLVAIYPAEGTFWTDHPLALLDLGIREGEQKVTDNQRLTYRAFTQFLTGNASQQKLLATGYRPANLNIELDSAGSPFANTDAVDWRQPQTTLQMPSSVVVDVVFNFWYYTKRPTNVYLVVDTSGSMEKNNKIGAARDALQAFVNQIQGDRDQIALVEFGSGTKNFEPLRKMDDSSRADLLNTIERMRADGGTALIDAVYAAAQDLVEHGDSEAINAIVVMTDGKENESVYGLSELNRLLSSQQPAPVIFTIAFGSDADEEMLTEIARIGGGQFRRASEIDLQELYKTISTYF